MLTVRPVEEKDFDSALKLLKEFQAESLDAYNLLCNDKIALSIMPKFIGSSFVLETDNAIVGVIAGIIVTYPLNDEKIYHEQIWYVNKTYRKYGIKLYLKPEQYCKKNNIKKIIMVSMANSKTQKLEEFYKRLGYKLLESHYIKNLNGRIN